jgi:cytochrome c oxidase subunit 4
MESARKKLGFVWLALLALLGATIGASYLFTGASSAVVGLGIALAKSTLIFWFFMQLREEKGLVRIFAVGAVVWLTILLLLSAIDYLTRWP